MSRESDIVRYEQAWENLEQRFNPFLLNDTESFINATGVIQSKDRVLSRMEGKQLIERFASSVVQLIQFKDKLLIQRPGLLTLGKLEDYLNSLQVLNEYSRTLTFVSFGDTNGIFYFIGTEYGTTSFSSPIAYGVLTTPSTFFLTDRTDTEFVSDEDYTPSIDIDLGLNREAIPNRITIKGSVNTPPIIQIRASKNNVQWDFLATDNQSWSEGEERSYEIATLQTYKYFRIVGGARSLYGMIEYDVIDIYVGADYEDGEINNSVNQGILSEWEDSSSDHIGAMVLDDMESYTSGTTILNAGETQGIASWSDSQSASL